jgi:hypothetical protein
MKTNKLWSVMIMLVVVLFSALSLSSCSGDDDEEELIFSLSTSSLDFTARGGEKSFTVNSNTSWLINGAKSWCYVSMTQGKGTQSVNVEVEKNTTNEERTYNTPRNLDNCKRFIIFAENFLEYAKRRVHSCFQG